MAWPVVQQLATCGFIDAGEDVILAGPIGTGKSMLAVALGMEAARRRYRGAHARRILPDTPCAKKKLSKG